MNIAIPNGPTTSADLLRLIERGKAHVAAMGPEAREAYFAEQRRRSVLAEMSMPNEDSTVTVQSEPTS